MNPNYAALSASDGAGEAVRATVQSPGRSIGSTTIPVNATTNWPTGTFIATTGTLLSSGKLDPATVQVFYGTASGTNITITSYAAGYTDKGNVAGDVVVIKPSTEWANIVSLGIQSTGKFPANFVNFVEPVGGIWSAGVGLAGSATAGYVWYGGTRSAMAAVAANTFTANKDTYVDYNPSAATWAYVAVSNGAAEPAVTANSVRIAKVITGASAITSISQERYDAPVNPEQLVGGTGASWIFKTYTPTVVGWSSTTTANIYYIQIGKTVILQIDYEGTSNNTLTTLTLPVPCSTHLAKYNGAIGLAQDNGVVLATTRWEIVPGTDPNLLNLFSNNTGGTWTASGTKVIRVSTIIYEAA